MQIDVYPEGVMFVDYISTATATATATTSEVRKYLIRRIGLSIQAEAIQGI